MPVNILLVDDKPENLIALDAALKQPDRRVIQATSGDEALRLLLDEPFALPIASIACCAPGGGWRRCSTTSTGCSS